MTRSGLLLFSWRHTDGQIVNWWSDDVGRDRRRFVHNEWGKFVVGIDLRQREAQIQIHDPPEWRTIRFEDVTDSENVQLAFQAVSETGEHAAFATELLLRAIGRDDLADLVARGQPKSAAREQT